MERMWARLLNRPLSNLQDRSLECATSRSVSDRLDLHSFTGARRDCQCSAGCGVLQPLTEKQIICAALKLKKTEYELRDANIPEDICNDLDPQSVISQAQKTSHIYSSHPLLRVAVFVQLGESTLQTDILECLRAISQVFVKRLDVFISSFFTEDEHKAKMLLKRLMIDNIYVIRVKNKGADVGQFLQQLHRNENKYDLALKIHTKTDMIWRRHTFASMCGTPSKVDAIYNRFRDEKLGMIAPKGTVITPLTETSSVWSHIVSKHFFNFKIMDAFDGSIMNKIKNVASTLGMTPKHNDITLIAGTMFWTVYPAFVEIFSSSWTHFHETLTPAYQRNGKLEHVFERLFATAIKSAGYSIETSIPAIRPLALYFPQYHRLPENDRFWGSGFTEWTLLNQTIGLENIKYPLSVNNGLGYYNLLNKETRKRQVELALYGGVHGFIYYHYWFGSQKVMYRVPELRLQDDFDFPFALSWANEPWSQRWKGGSEDNVLMAQEYGSLVEWRKHIEYLLPFFMHKDYIRVDNRPMFIIYRMGHIGKSKLTEMISYWEGYLKTYGILGLHIVETIGNFYKKEDYAPIVSAGFHFWPQLAGAGLFDLNPDNVASTQDLLTPHKVQYWGGFTGFDRRPRDHSAIPILRNCSTIGKGFSKSFAVMAQKEMPIDNYFFITAFNEWNEQAVLEPDEKSGFCTLDALRGSLGTQL